MTRGVLSSPTVRPCFPFRSVAKLPPPAVVAHRIRYAASYFSTYKIYCSLRSSLSYFGSGSDFRKYASYFEMGRTRGMLGSNHESRGAGHLKLRRKIVFLAFGRSYEKSVGMFSEPRNFPPESNLALQIRTGCLFYNGLLWLVVELF